MERVGDVLASMSQQTILGHLADGEAQQGETLKAKGIGAVAGASPNFMSRAGEAIKALAKTDENFTAEDVAYLCGRPERRNAMGAALNAAARAGIIRRVGVAKANRKTRHASLLSVWRGV